MALARRCKMFSQQNVVEPDVVYFRPERQHLLNPSSAAYVAPDLAVEVISPGDLAFEIREKISEYLRAGVRLMWVVYRSMKMVEVYRPTEGPHATLHEHDTISGEDVLPGFSYPVRDFFAR